MNNHLIPSKSQAEAFLADAGQRNPGPWVQHSIVAAQAMHNLAKAIIDQNPNEPQYAGLDPNRAYILGLLHDIGRREGVHGLRHIMDGYHFLAQEGYPDAGRVCLTHAFPDKTLIPDAARWDGTPEDLTFVRSYIQSIQYDIYDRLSQLVDSISMPHGFVLMEKRMVDVIMRYGANGNTPARYFVQRWKANFALVDEIESAIHGSIYTHLPGVVQNTFSSLP